jgi:import receptor subunit TOM20
MTVASVAVSGILAYAVYFDYKRRTDANFRKQLRKFSLAESSVTQLT